MINLRTLQQQQKLGSRSGKVFSSHELSCVTSLLHRKRATLADRAHKCDDTSLVSNPYQKPKCNSQKSAKGKEILIASAKHRAWFQQTDAHAMMGCNAESVDNASISKTQPVLIQAQPAAKSEPRPSCHLLRTTVQEPLKGQASSQSNLQICIPSRAAN